NTPPIKRQQRQQIKEHQKKIKLTTRHSHLSPKIRPRCTPHKEKLEQQRPEQCHREISSGPAIATQRMSCLGRFKRDQLTGTGLAQPKIKPAPPMSLAVNNKNSGTAIVPIGSI